MSREITARLVRAERDMTGSPLEETVPICLLLDDARQEIQILRRALAWHGELGRMATTREEWQQTIDAAIVWVKANPEPNRPSFPSMAAYAPADEIEERR